MEVRATESFAPLPTTGPAEPAALAAPAAERLASIDRLRGLVMVLMALDHVRDYFSVAGIDPLDLGKTNTALFFMRWVTHLCAPTFILLAGVSARLMSARATRRQLSLFLLTRGLWLIVLELTVVQFAWSFNLRYDRGVFLQVIWAIGASMVLLAPLVFLPVWLIAVVGVVQVVGHNALDGVGPERFGPFALVWRFLHVQGEVPFGMVIYPLVPWVGLMALGFVLGGVYGWDPARRKRALGALGGGCLLAFVGLRFINGYGDPHPWSPQNSAWFSALSFVDVHKYPPSLDYVLVMGGIACLLLVAFERGTSRWMAPLVVLGRVPLFFYVMHLVLLHALAGLVALALGFGTQVLGNVFMLFPPGWGFSLPGVYLAWMVVVVALYPACLWYAAFKRRHGRAWWVSYL